MPMCPHCRTAVYVTATSCGKCGASLTDEGGGLTHLPFDPPGELLRVTDRTTIFLCVIVVLFIFAILVVNDASLF
jgi:hypothetical protein